MPHFWRRGSVRRSSVWTGWSKKKEWTPPNQKLDDLWAIPLKKERGELRLREWRRYSRNYRQHLKQVEDLSESGGIGQLLRDVLPAYWNKRVEDEEKKRAKKRMAVRIMSPEEPQPSIIECF